MTTTTIRFGPLKANVSRNHRIVGIYTLAGEPVGAITRKPRGYLSWATFGPRKIPLEILDVVSTMV